MVQSIIAAEVGYADMALKYFLTGLFVDLADLHRNTSDGVHIASAGGVWAALVSGFAGMRDNGRLSFDPRLPAEWEGLSFPLVLRGHRLVVELTKTAIEFTLDDGDPIEVWGAPNASWCRRESRCRFHCATRAPGGRACKGIRPSSGLLAAMDR